MASVRPSINGANMCAVGAAATSALGRGAGAHMILEALHYFVHTRYYADVAVHFRMHNGHIALAVNHGRTTKMSLLRITSA